MNHLALTKNGNRRNAGNAIASSDGWLLIHMEIADADLSRKLLVQLFDEWPDRVAGAAPGGPEVNENYSKRAG